jgi:outer membrane protein OmpA-like peptidoglycan-associated protein
MKLLGKLYLSLIAIVFATKLGIAQFYFLEDVHDQIEVQFFKHKIETEPNTTFFNVLKIKNPSNQQVTFQTNFSYPASWSFMGEKNQQITLDPNDSILIPFRASASNEAKGEIGYAIVASLTDLKGNTFKNEYSFVNIPKKIDIKFTPLARLVFFDQVTKNADINLLFSNNGNTDEIFYLDLIFDNSITTKGEQDGHFKTEISIDPHMDTIIDLSVFLKPNFNDPEKKFHRINIKANSIDTSFNTSIWVKELDRSYYNPIPDNYKMLSIEATAQNLFSQIDPSYSFAINGNLLFRKRGDLIYSINSYGSQFYDDPWKYGRYLLHYKEKKFNIKFGDVNANLTQDLFGRGGLAEMNLKSRNIIKTIFTTSMFTDKSNIGISYQRIFPFGFIETGGSYVEDKTRKVNSWGGLMLASIRSKKIGSFTPTVSITLAEWNINEPKQQMGFSGGLQFNSKFKNTFVIINTRYADRLYFGRNEGRIEVRGNVTHYLKNNINYLMFYYNLTNSNPAVYNDDELVFGTTNIFEESRTTFNTPLTNSLFLNLGLMSEMRFGNNFYNYDSNVSLKTRNALVYGSLRFRVPNSQNIFSMTLKAGPNFITDYNKESIDLLNDTKNWFSLVANLNYRTRYWGFFASYYHGPSTISQQLTYLTRGYNSKNIRLLPYIDVFIIPQFLKVSIKPNFLYDIPAKTSRVNMGTDLIGYPGKSWTITFTNALSYSASVDKISEEKFTYTNTYFELRIKKDFNLNQPRYQYHDLKIHFFKDLNGNRVKDADEPGIKDIMFSIEMDEEKLIGQKTSNAGYFMPMDLLSDQNGYISYDNVPNGFYIIKYTPIGKMQGSFSSETNTQAVYIGNDETLFIPFFENNKIFGKVILNRSKLSNLGSIDPSNIKVTAEDTHGRKYSTLTDGNGNYNIYVPNVDRYSVKINNIFYENFELEQNDYEVQLNGYRQFEVNFIFNEKKRKINFAASYDYGSRLDGPGVEIVRRTNLAGTIKDATTLQPIVANIRVIDNQGNEVTSANSSSKTGVFTASFVAGDDYTVEVTSDDYWFYAEKLYSQQIVTFANLKKEILLKAITVGALIPMNTLNFESGKTEIPATSFPELERLLKVLKKNPTVKIAVHGHTDDLELKESQIDLATERAKLVAKYLIANGYNRVTYAGHANTKPIAENDTEDGRRMNRRVEIVVTGK